MNTLHPTLLIPSIILACMTTFASAQQTDAASDRARVIVTTDGEIDDECSMVRFLLYANEFDVEGIVTSSSQYHWQGHKWAGDDWIEPLLEAYEKVYPNLIQHDPDFPTPDYLKSITVLGNVKSEGDMDKETVGSELIVTVLLDESDNGPIWLQAWGGPNTIARALKTIEEKHPEKMAAVAKKIRFYFIWEQDDTYQEYIRPRWGKFNIPTIISDQFIAFAYERQRKVVPQEVQRYFSAKWMNENALQNHGPLLEMYKAHDDGRFRSEGDSPAFLHVIPTGLRSDESPDWGGWGGRFMLNGDQYPGKKFGGESGDDPDYYRLIIKGIDDQGGYTSTVVFYLADFRFADNSQDYIIDDWTWCDLTGLGNVVGLEFSVESSDTGDYGLNNPSYFAMDNLNGPSPVPIPGAVWLLGSGILALIGIRRRQHS